MKRKIKLGLVIIWMVIIFLFSNQNGAGSDGLTYKVIDSSINAVQKVTGQEKTVEGKAKTTERVFVAVRKSAHFFEYLILAILVISLLKEYSLEEKKKYALAIAIVALYAITDEIHQLFVPNRSGRIFDVFVDISGAITGLLFYVHYLKIRKDGFILKIHEKWNLYFILISWLFLLSTWYFGFKLVEINVLTSGYIFGILEMILIIFIAIFVIFKKFKKRFVKWICGIILICLIIFLNVASVKIDEFISALTGMTTKEIVEDKYYVVGYKEKSREYQTVHYTPEDIEVDKLKTKLSNDFVEQSSYVELIEKFLQSKDIYIVISEAYHEMLVEVNSEYEDNYVILYEFTIETKVSLEESNLESLDPFVLYISGIDTYGSISKRSRSDVNMIVVVNPKKKEMLLVHIPRDYYVQLAGKSGLKDKLTHSGIYGINNSVKTIENFMDIDINYYLRVNFNTVISLVDLIGGIEIDSDGAFKCWTNSKCDINKGINQLDGKCALAYSRERFAYTTGDFHRGENQQQVMTAIINKITTDPKLLQNYSKYLSILNNSFQTDMSYEMITDLMKHQIETGINWNIESIGLKGTGASEYTYSYGSQKLYVMNPDFSSIKKAQDKIKKVLEN